MNGSASCGEVECLYPAGQANVVLQAALQTVFLHKNIFPNKRNMHYSHL